MREAVTHNYDRILGFTYNNCRYYYSKVAAKNVCYLYRVVEQRGGRFVCYPEARGWPRLTFCSHKELQKSFKLLLDDQIFSCKPDPVTEPGLVRFPDLEELRMDWQLGSTVYFRHCDVRTPGKVVGRFVWMQQPCGEIGGSAMPHLRLVFLLQLPTNELLLSSQVCLSVCLSNCMCGGVLGGNFSKSILRSKQILYQQETYSDHAARFHS